MRKHRVLTLLVFLFVLSAQSGGAQTKPASNCKLTEGDRSAIKQVIEDYRTSWLTDNGEGVRRTFTDDAVLLPAHGTPPVVGMVAIKKWWWPADSKPTTIDKLDLTIAQIQGDCQLAFARGTDFVAWTVQEETGPVSYSHPGTYLNVMKKLPDGSWRIWQHMWDDPVDTVVKKKN